MTFAPGTRLGPCEILARLGAVGMGEVWRARDAWLGRDVAITALPEAFARDPQRLARFEREVKMLASLNHSNSSTSFWDSRPRRTRYDPRNQSAGRARFRAGA